MHAVRGRGDWPNKRKSGRDGCVRKVLTLNELRSAP
jgi:hypothetical protein